MGRLSGKAVTQKNFKNLHMVADTNHMEAFYLIAAFIIGGLAGWFTEYIKEKCPF